MTEDQTGISLESKGSADVYSCSAGFESTGAFVQELRARLDMSASELSALLGVVSATVMDWETKRILNLRPRSHDAMQAAAKLSKTQAWP